MNIVILRGGAPRRRRNDTRNPETGTRDRGVMAISDGSGSGHWALVNMSPAVAHQLDSDARLDQHPGLPDGGLRTVLLTDAQVDHVGGLLSLRDGAPIELYATPAVFEELTTALPVLPVLQHYCGVHWHVVPVAGDRQQASFRVEGLPGLEFTAVATRAPAPPHMARGEHGVVGDSIALAIRDTATGQRVFCAPGLAQPGSEAFEWMQGADCLLMDCPDAEAAPDWLAAMRALPARHKVLLGPADEALPLADEGIALAYDGMEISL
ncbi:MBL fold metallo-hydrolase [Ideonella sp. DXS22W]|uniref:MBL fold metallo-hydrolase n=1 Tax=Pseudaquabacterium inlustre TaxID=2984192 RepID=A0ABU9CEL1_9BURK